MVSRIDYDKVEEASFLRRVLEIAVVREACKNASPIDIRELDDNLALQNLYLDKGDAEKLFILDDAFHRELFRMARKMLSFQLMRSLSAHFDRVRQLSLVVIKDIRMVDEHRHILDAIKAGDQERAQEVMTSHLNGYRMDEAAIREKFARYMVD